MGVDSPSLHRKRNLRVTMTKELSLVSVSFLFEKPVPWQFRIPTTAICLSPSQKRKATQVMHPIPKVIQS
ncbi:hypothetical protein RJ641_003958 [Dillenia turbinata]|uniref:Uncharacterized protein n=1 Tax=Dillenia turbinata TaxID=194707 RepID=A0AAN8Z7T8_9MAGN